MKCLECGDELQTNYNICPACDKKIHEEFCQYKQILTELEEWLKGRKTKSNHDLSETEHAIDYEITVIISRIDQLKQIHLKGE